MSNLRFKAVEEALKRRALDIPVPKTRPSEYFGELVFNRQKMFNFLRKQTFDALIDTIDNGTTLNRQVADEVAAGMKKWAMEKGVTHYTHWFQPLTGGTAEKHDAFIEHDGKGGLVEEFSGKLLIQQEGDASSFPNGGIRNTFEARGYSAWDPTSPAFIVGTTLCIPTVFIAYTGETLDFKTPLLRSINALNKYAVDVCQYFDEKVTRVSASLGIEQEYFLVDEALWAARPDLMLTGRTLMGHESAKNQQLEDHYFGSIPSRVAAFMRDIEYECYKLGIPCKTRHNEVAPNQFEIAPIYEEMNLANDHNLQLMSVMKKIARKHYFRLILHEKPFKGINGSGKHNNWSMSTNTGINLLSPGKDANQNLQFVTFLVNIMMAVYKRGGLLKGSIASATNIHRLGANEAPPSIISVFLGSQLTDVLDKLENANSEEAIKLDEKVGLSLGVTSIPELLIDNTDRNRTSPFAFTGNRFEFRAVGSSANSAASMIVLNTAVAYQLKEFKTEVDKQVANGKTLNESIFALLQQYIKECKAIRFDGNGYSKDWIEQARQRGLDCETSVPLIFDNYLKPENIEMFHAMNVLSETELHARNEVKWETFTKKVQIEARILGDLALNHIIPTASRYQISLLDKVTKIQQLFKSGKSTKIAEQDLLLIEEISDHIYEIKSLVNEMVEARKQSNLITEERSKAIAYQENVFPLFEKIRSHIDKLELIVDDEMWTLPKYRELLFIR